MIIVDEVDKDYMRCQSCYEGKENKITLKSISIGFREQSVTTFRLCEKCIEDLKSKL